MSTAPQQQSLPWMEKYRPRRLNDLVHQRHVRDMLRAYIQKPHLPHLLLYGPPGTGKTTSILAFANEIFGPEYCQERVYELNASHERDINTVREKVKAFANIYVTSHPSATHPCPAYKIIILDEADAMTAEAQRALRRIMETTTQQTRFCLICNYASKIIDPIVSRCTPMRFKPIPPSIMAARLRAICAHEKLAIAEAPLRQLLVFSGGDFRVALNTLQSLRSLLRTAPETLTQLNANATAFFQDTFGLAPASEVAAFGSACLDTNATLQRCTTAVDRLLNAGFDTSTFLRQLVSYFIQHTHHDHDLDTLLQALADCEYRCIHGANVRIQLLHLTMVLSSARVKKNENECK